MEYNEILSLMQEMIKIGLTRIKIEKDNFKLVLEKSSYINSSDIAAPVPDTCRNANVYAEPVNTSLQESDSVRSKDDTSGDSADKGVSGMKKILSPMVGTFYAQPAPDKPPYVSVGDMVKKGQTVCIIEAMKLMNEIESEVEGKIIECLVENEEMVEFGQPLFLVE